MKSSEVQCVLFDLDGTLIDTAPDMVNALNQVLEEENRQAMPFEQVRDFVSHGSAALIRLGFGDKQPEHLEAKRRQRFLDIYRDQLCVDSCLFPEMNDLLSSLESQKVQWGVVTNKPGWLTDPLMAELNLTQRAACVISGDTFSERKPHPLPMYKAAELAGVTAASCLYVGDAERDIQAGNAAGMTTLIASFGYIDQHQQPERWGADGAIDSPLDVLAWIESS